MPLFRLLRTAVSTARGAPRLWLHPLGAALASAVVLAFALVGERHTLIELASQLRATTVSSSFVDVALDAQARLATVAIVLIPVVLVLVLFWMERFARMGLIVQRTTAANLTLPRRRGRLLAALARYEAGCLALVAVLVVVLPGPTSGWALAVWIAGAIVLGSVLTLGFHIVVLLRPTTRTLTTTAARIVAANPGTFVGLLCTDVLEGIIALALLGFPLFFALKLHAYGAALLAGGVVSLLILPLLVLHVVSWSIFTLAGLEQQARLRASTPTAAA